MIYPDKNIQIAGLLYYSFDDPVIEIESSEIDTGTEQPEFSDQEKLDAERMEKMKLQGFVNESPAVIQKMDHTCNQSLPVKLDKMVTSRKVRMWYRQTRSGRSWN